MTVLTATRWNAFLDCACLMKTCEMLPHTPLWESFFFGASSYIHDHHLDGKLQAYDLFVPRLPLYIGGGAEGFVLYKLQSPGRFLTHPARLQITLPITTLTFLNISWAPESSYSSGSGPSVNPGYYLRQAHLGCLCQ